ncbi:MAG: aromatic aminobenezylarsenical efflux permease ArsG family transporter [candidate division Zixibacteria bacterium]|nr:aromatic aminobenezylarsenical efflux permease ArsG family transporter [candidate division Zixibacteria bacterium]
MDSILIASGSALWLGILTSISPCPLATNIAAISYIGRQVGSTSRIFLSGLAYTIGRMLVYLVLGIIIMVGLLSVPGLSNFLQRYLNIVLGPLLIIVGVFLLDIIRFAGFGLASGERVQEWAKRGGVLGAGFIGFVFALSLCPVSAALFFGSLIPLAVQHNSKVLLPLLYGIGTGLPVIVFAFLLAFGTQIVGRAFDNLRRIEKWVRYITAVIFIIVGIYYSLIYIFKLPL